MNSTSDNVAQWRRMCADIERDDRNAFHKGVQFCVLVSFLAFVAAIPFLCIIGAGP